MRIAVSTKKKVVVTLWRLAANTDYRTVGHLFGLARSTVCMIVNEVCHVIVKKMLHCFVKIPIGEELAAVMDGF